MKSLQRLFLWASILLINVFFLLNCSGDKSADPDQPVVPTLTTASVSDITEIEAQCGGNITSDGGEVITARGVCWSTGSTPTITDNITSDGTGTGSFTSSINGLITNTHYYVRSYATNSVGTGYGSIRSFTTAAITDFDGNAYQAVIIGTQVWMAENLKVTHYRNGDAIPNVTGNTEWQNLSSGAYCEYNNDVNNVVTYGRLYNWHAVNDDRDLAPTGWHVPTDAEWQTLMDYLGGDMLAGGKMKETGTTHWTSPNSDATNESGFTSLPGGQRNWNGTWYELNTNAWFWSSTEDNSLDAWYRALYYNNGGVARDNYLKLDGFSIRCVKD